MHVLFVHQNYPAQFRHIARRLVNQHGWKCNFLSETPPGDDGGIRKIQYRPIGGRPRGDPLLQPDFRERHRARPRRLRGVQGAPSSAPT